MATEKHYIAYADTGRDYIDFEFCSSHKANSKANKEDAQCEYKRNHGHRLKEIRKTFLLTD